MSSEDVLNELVNTVKELTEKNFSLALKVNELENKVTQIDQNKNDITVLKKGFDAATTDRTAIKDLLNLKTKELISTIDEKVGSVRRELTLFKEDFNHLSNNFTAIKQNITNLQNDIEKSLKQMSSDTIKNLESIRSIMDKKISTNLESITNLQKDLDNKNNNIGVSIKTVATDLQGKIDGLTTKITSLNTDLMNKFQVADKAIVDDVLKTKDNLNSTIQSNAQKIQETLTNSANELRTEIKNLEETNNSLFGKMAADTANELQQLIDVMNTKFENQSSNITNLSSQTDMNFGTVKNQMQKFFEISDNHSEVLKAFEEIVGQIRSNINLANTETKKDQELILESFQKIIMGQAENLRNELLTFSKEIRTNLSKFNDETDVKFTSKDETNKLNEKMKILENDLRLRSDSTRKELIATVEESVQKFNSAIKESISSVDEYRVDLERFKDDIESLVERKVNEKNEFSMELFNNLLTKAEQISKLIQDSKISKIPAIAVPIPEIKNSKE